MNSHTVAVVYNDREEKRSMMIGTVRKVLPVVAAVLVAVSLTACGGTEKESGPTATKSVKSELEGLPEAPKGFLVAPFDDQVRGDQHDPGEDGVLKLPGQAVSITSVTSLKKIPSEYLEQSSSGAGDSAPDEDNSDSQDGDSDAKKYLRAADGEQFVVVELSHSSDEQYQYEAPKVTILVENGGSRTRVFDSADSTQRFLVSAGDDAKLILAVDGHDVAASLISGERQPGGVTDVLYRDGIKQDLAKTLKFKAVKTEHGPNFTVRYSTEIDSVNLVPYLPAELSDGEGTWAEDGKAFLLVNVSGSAGVVTYGDSRFYVVNTVQTWVAAVDGEKFTAKQKLKFGLNSGESYTAVIEVPAEASSVELTVSANTKAEDSFKGKVSLNHGSKSVNVMLG